MEYIGQAYIDMAYTNQYKQLLIKVMSVYTILYDLLFLTQKNVNFSSQ